MPAFGPSFLGPKKKKADTIVIENPIFSFFDRSIYATVRFNIEVRKKIVCQMLPHLSGKRILDIGCGDGSISLSFADRNSISLIDGSKKMLDLARKRAKELAVYHSVDFVSDDFFSYSFSETFDVVLCIGVLAHVTDHERLFHKINEVISPKGVLIIQMSDSLHFRYRRKPHDDSSYGYQLNRITKGGFTNLLAKHNFKVDKEDKYSWTFLPISYMPQSWQGEIIFRMRNVWPFDKLSSEYVFMCSRDNT